MKLRLSVFLMHTKVLHGQHISVWGPLLERGVVADMTVSVPGSEDLTIAQNS